MAPVQSLAGYQHEAYLDNTLACCLLSENSGPNTLQAMIVRIVKCAVDFSRDYDVFLSIGMIRSFAQADTTENILRRMCKQIRRFDVACSIVQKLSISRTKQGGLLGTMFSYMRQVAMH